MFTPGRDSKTVFFRDQVERIFRYSEDAEKSRASSEK